MKRNTLIILTVVIISACIILAAALYRNSSPDANATSDLDPALAASVVTQEVSGTTSSESKDSTGDSELTNVPDGVYTNGSESMIFEGNTVDISGMIFDYTLNNGYVALDIDSLRFSDYFITLYEDANNDDQDIDTQLSKTKESASSITIQYNSKFDWVTYEEYIFKRSEDYSTGPNGTYISEDNEAVTLTFEDGVATYINGDTTLTYPYVIYLDGEDTVVTFYTLDFYTGDLYDTYCENNYFYYSDESSLDLGFGTFVKKDL